MGQNIIFAHKNSFKIFDKGVQSPFSVARGHLFPHLTQKCPLHPGPSYATAVRGLIRDDARWLNK